MGMRAVPELLRTLDAAPTAGEIAAAAAELGGAYHRDPASAPRCTGPTLLCALRRLAGPDAVEGAPRWTPPVRGRAREARVLLGGGPALAAAQRPLSESEAEAASGLLALLSDLVGARPEDRVLARTHLLQADGAQSGLLWLLLRIFAGGACARGDSATVVASLFLAHVADGDEQLVVVLQNARLLDLLAAKLLRATDGDVSAADWLPVATAVVSLVDVLVALGDSAACKQLGDPSLFRPVWATGSKPDLLVDALLAALRRSLRQGSASTVLQLRGLRALRHIAQRSGRSGQQAQRVLAGAGAELAVAVLNLDRCDSEAAETALDFLAEVACWAQAPALPAKRLSEAGAGEAAKRAMARYPWAAGVQKACARVLMAC